MASDQNRNQAPSLYKGIGPLGVWGMALGTSIGWGSLVVTSNTYLSQSGPVGSVVGIIIATFIMLIISRNYAYLINLYPDAGGLYTYTKETFGYDHGFLSAWFLALTYLAVLWANATSLPLFARYFLGGIFRVGKLYTLFGYDVYLGEALLAIAALLLTMLLCTRSRKGTMGILTGLVILFTIGITVCFVGALISACFSGHSFKPGFVPDKNALTQIVRIACISPWAFIGFENISHAAEEYSFPHKKINRILTIAVISTTALYIFVLLLSISAYPPEYESWLEYLRDLGNLEGIKGLPAFYAANHYLGQPGILLLILSLLALIITSLIGNSVALSRLFYSMARDEVLPDRFAELNDQHVPANAFWLVGCISLIVPFLGRTTIGWIVDVTTIGATLIYGFVSAAAYKNAKEKGDSVEVKTGLAGLLFMISFGMYLLLPNLFSIGSMEKETYFLFVVWGVLGFIFFRNILARDNATRFGKSMIVWIGLLSMVLLVSLIWMSQSLISSKELVRTHIEEHFFEKSSTDEYTEDTEFIEDEIRDLKRTDTRTILTVAGLFSFSLAIMLTNYSHMKKREEEQAALLGHAQSVAYKDPLTGVKSKNAYVENERILNESIRDGNPDAFSIVVCDVNGLKYVNDTFGHKAGDEYIISAAELICDVFVFSSVFRIGGDEFVVLLIGPDHSERENLLRALRQRSEENIKSDKVVIASGMSDFVPGEDKDVHSVFERADAIMYQNKQALKGMGARTR